MISELLIGAFVITVIAKVAMRFKKANRRLQACLDNGAVTDIIDGYIICADTLSEAQERKVKFEFDFYNNFKPFFLLIDRPLKVLRTEQSNDKVESK